MEEYRRLARERWAAKAEKIASLSIAESYHLPTPETATLRESIPSPVLPSAHDEKLPHSSSSATVSPLPAHSAKLSRMLGQYVSSRPDLRHLRSGNNDNALNNDHDNNNNNSNLGDHIENKNNAVENRAESKQAEENAAKSEAACWICGSGVEAGRLISPCLCIGTLRLVHVDCINTWRRLSANPQSYYQCDMCKYKYHVERTRFASLMQSFNVAQFVTTLAILAWVLLAGMVCYPLGFHNWFYEIVEWIPFWLSSDSNFYSLAAVLDYITAGVLGVGIMGLALDSYICIQMQNYHHIYLALACIAHGPRHMRLVALLGFGLSGRFVFRVVRQKCLELLHRWGEMMLEVRRE